MVTVLSLPQWAGHPEFVQMLIPYAKSADKTQDLIYLLELPQWKGKKELIEQLIKDGIAYYYVFENILPLPEWQGRADLVLKMMKTQFCDTQVARLLALPGWTDPKLAKAVLSYKAFSSGEALMKAMVEQPAWAQYPEIVAEMITTYTSDYAQNVIAATVLSRKEWVDHPELLELMLTMPGGAEAVEKNILSQSHWQKSRALRELIPGIGKDRIHIEDLQAAIQDRQVPQKKAKSKAGKGLRCEGVFR
jgi:hypothetical protein